MNEGDKRGDQACQIKKICHATEDPIEGTGEQRARWHSCQKAPTCRHRRARCFGYPILSEHRASKTLVESSWVGPEKRAIDSEPCEKKKKDAEQPALWSCAHGLARRCPGRC